MKYNKMLNIAELAIQKLNLDDVDKYYAEVKYHGKFNAYNANVRLRNDKLAFNLSKKWKKIDKDIQIGLIQELALKILKKRNIRTTNIDLYNIFIKKVHISIPKTLTDPLLEKSFDRVNSNCFYNIIEKPNLKWGTMSTTKLGSYEYGSDTITISKIFQNVDPFLLDYIMYHEILHKKHKYYTKNSKNIHHSTKFRKDEKAFPNQRNAEKELQSLCKSLRKRRYGFFTIQFFI